MYYYKIHGLVAESDYKFIELIELEPQNTFDIVIRSTSLEQEYVEETAYELERDFGCMYHYGKEISVVRFVHHGAFVIKAGNTIEYQLRPNFDPIYVNQIFLTSCIYFLLLQRGNIELHGSGIVRNGKAIAICGASGAGKSTLTSELLLYKDIYFCADDTVVISNDESGPMVHAAYPQRKLCKDVALEFDYDINKLVRIEEVREKYAVPERTKFYSESAPLQAIFVIKIAVDEQVYIKEVIGTEKLKLLMSILYKVECFQNFGCQEYELKNWMKLARDIPMFIIERPQNQKTSKKQAQLLINTLDCLDGVGGNCCEYTCCNK